MQYDDFQIFVDKTRNLCYNPISVWHALGYALLTADKFLRSGSLRSKVHKEV